MADRYYRWRRSEPDPVIEFSKFEEQLWRALGQEDHNFIYQFKLFLAQATEHIAEQLVPIYRRIVLATEPSELYDLTTHRRFLIRTAAVQKIDFLEGRPLRKEEVTLNPLRWPQNAWNAARLRHRVFPGPQ